MRLIINRDTEANLSSQKYKTDVTAISTFWNRRKLSVGSHISATGSKPHGAIARSWSYDGVLNEAFRAIGKSTDRGDVRETHRELDAISAVVFPYNDLKLQHVSSLRMHFAARAASGDRAPWFWIRRHWDLTPRPMAFGRCQDLLLPIAAYWWRDKNAVGKVAWQKITHDEYKKRNLGREPKHGTLNIFASTLSIAWPETDENMFEVLRNEKMLCQPTVSGSKNAGLIYNSLEKCQPGLDWQNVLKMTKDIDLVVLSLGGDLDGSNLRVKLKYLEMAREHNADVTAEKVEGGRIAILSVDCNGHIIHVGIEHAFRTAMLIPRLHATSFLCTQTKFNGLVSQALLDIVGQDMASYFFPEMRPPVGASEHATIIINATLYRHNQTRGRGQDESPADNAIVDDIRDQLLDTINGWWSSVNLMHFCWQPGRSYD
jgi:hypothetical protein